MDTAKKVFEIDGKDFTDLNGFYHAIGSQLVENNDWGRNWDALDDIFSGGFIKTDYEEPFTLIWRNAGISRSTMSEYSDIVALINKHKHIELRIE